MSAGVFYPAREKEKTEKNKGRKLGEQMKLYPQSGLMVIHSDGLSDKEQRQKIKGKGETGQDKAKLMVLVEIKVKQEDQRRPS